MITIFYAMLFNVTVFQIQKHLIQNRKKKQQRTKFEELQHLH